MTEEPESDEMLHRQHRPMRNGGAPHDATRSIPYEASGVRSLTLSLTHFALRLR